MTNYTAEIFKNSLHDNNPAGVMRGLIKMRALGQTGTIAFHLADLQRALRAWEMAKLALLGSPRYAIAASEEVQRFTFLIHKLKQDIQHEQAVGFMLLDRNDWPPGELMHKAEQALIAAQMETVQ